MTLTVLFAAIVGLCAAAGSYHRWPPAAAAAARWVWLLLVSLASALLLVRCVGPAVLKP